MAFVEWTMRGVEIVNCNCEPGCPCQFNRPPTHRHCRAYTFVEIEAGRFGDVPLDGLRWGILASWPGPIHHGNGTFMAVVDERADPAQRAALEAVAQGRETDPGTLIWQVFSTTVSTLLPTVYAPIQFHYDADAREGRVRVPGLLDASVSPVTNPVTGQPHRARISLPTGFEYTEAEVASGTARSEGAIVLDFTDTHAHFAKVHWSTHGVVR
jgi:hypothetical protein